MALVLAGVLLSCAPRGILRPAPDASLIPREKRMAFAEAAGIRLVADPGAWSGDPAALPQYFTPIHVTIENKGNRPVRIQYQDFSLEDSTGFQALPLPPHHITGTIAAAPPAPSVYPGYTYHKFYLYPYYAPYYVRGLSMWADPFDYDAFYYDHYYSYWRTPLPTQDMIANAIPEGVLNPGGRLSGFVYFQKPQTSADRVELVFHAVDARNNETLGTLRIPFVIK